MRDPVRGPGRLPESLLAGRGGASPQMPQPIDDEEYVDERRAAVGLEPLVACVAQIRELYGDL
jgi:hypothetical protein